jgi:hypothetical protein
LSPAAPGLDAERPASPARRAAVSRALATIADQVAQLPEPYVRALQPVLLQAQDELAAGLKRWLANAPDAEERFTAQHLRNALVSTRHALEHMEKVVPIGVEGTLRAMGVASGELATRHLQEEVAVFAGVFGHSVRPVQLQQAAIIAEGREMLIPRYRSSAKRYGKDITKDIRHQLAIGISSGETFAQLTDRLQRHGGPKGLVSVAGVLGEPGARSEYIAEGLFKKYRGWAARVVRTEGLRAYNAHHLIGLEMMDDDDPGYAKRWDATNDKVCDICRRLDGEVVEIDAPFILSEANAKLDLPAITAPHPPAHPNCRCALTPWRHEWGRAPIVTHERPPVIEPVAPPPAEKVAKEPRQPKPAPPRPVAPPPPTPALEQERIAREAAEAERRRADAERARLGELERQREAADRAAAEVKRLADQLAKETADRARAEAAAAKEAAAKADRERIEAEKRRKDEEAKAAAEVKRKTDEAARLQEAAQKRKDAEAKEAAERAEKLRLEAERKRAEEEAAAKRFREKVEAEQSRLVAEKARVEAAKVAAAAMAKPSATPAIGPAQAATPEQIARLVAGASDPTGAKLPDARAALQEILRAQGLPLQPGYEPSKLAAAAVDKRPNLTGSDAYNSPGEGCVYSPAVAANGANFSAMWHQDRKAFVANQPATDVAAQALQGMRVIVHEEYHTFGGMRNSEYKGSGILAEEVAVEVSARRFMREVFGANRDMLTRDGAYPMEVKKALDAVHRIEGVKGEDAWRRLEDASLRFKQREERSWHGDLYMSPAERLADDLAGGDPVKAANYRSHLIHRDEQKKFDEMRKEQQSDWEFERSLKR